MVEDLASSGRPWAQIIAGAGERIRVDLVADGVVQILIEMHRDIRCSYDMRPQVNFVLLHCNGLRVFHRPHKSKDEPLRYQMREQQPVRREMDVRNVSVGDEVRAFRLATEWYCRGLWDKDKPGVFIDLMSRFQSEVWQDQPFGTSDFQWHTSVPGHQSASGYSHR